MKLKIRTWNMNYWKERSGDKAKSKEKINEWIKTAKQLILDEEDIDIFALQESSLNMLMDENIVYKFIQFTNVINISHNNKNFAFLANPHKYLNWGLLTISKGIEGTIYAYNNVLAYICYDFTINNKEITIVNIHLQKDFNTKVYYPTFEKLIVEVNDILNKKSGCLVLLMGDFNASDKFPSDELENFKKAFVKIRKIGFVDCTSEIPLEQRSTMLDYSYQNDYIFINEAFKNIILDIKIRKDIETDYIDHYPIDICIEL